MSADPPLDTRTHLPDVARAEVRIVRVPFFDIMTPSGIGTQALFGQRFAVARVEGALAYGALLSILPSSNRVDYVGTVPERALSQLREMPTHRVSVVHAPVFSAPDIKSSIVSRFDRNVMLSGELSGDFLQIDQSRWVHCKHVQDVDRFDPRPYQDVAADMLHRPYVWGGTGAVGVDCSGLVQSALAATGLDAPRDADQQEAMLGDPVEVVTRRAGDLVFWPGHVGIIVEGDRLLHANAYHMQVAVEPYEGCLVQLFQLFLRHFFLIRIGEGRVVLDRVLQRIHLVFGDDIHIAFGLGHAVTVIFLRVDSVLLHRHVVRLHDHIRCIVFHVLQRGVIRIHCRSINRFGSARPSSAVEYL